VEWLEQAFHGTLFKQARTDAVVSVGGDEDDRNRLPATRQFPFAITPEAYSLTQLRNDVRKLRAHGLLQRDGRRRAYRLSPKGVKVAAMFVLFHKRVCGPSPTPSFITGPQKHPHRLPRLKRRTTKPMSPVNNSLTCSPREKI
jgi:hypothetical protein